MSKKDKIRYEMEKYFKSLTIGTRESASTVLSLSIGHEESNHRRNAIMQYLYDIERTTSGGRK